MATKVIRGRSVFLTRERVLSLRLCATARPAESSIHAPALDRLECSVCFLAVPWTQAHVMSQGGPVSCWLCCCRERVAGESRRPTEGLPCVAVLREALATCLWGELGFLAQDSMSGSQGLPLAQAGLPLCLSCWGGVPQRCTSNTLPPGFFEQEALRDFQSTLKSTGHPRGLTWAAAWQRLSLRKVGEDQAETL